MSVGKANRERRRMKAAARRRTSSGRNRGPGGSHGPTGARGQGTAYGAAFDAQGASFFSPFEQAPPPTVLDQVVPLVGQALDGLDRSNRAMFARAVDRLAARDDAAWRRQVEQTVQGMLTSTVTALWQAGWQPADLLRIVTRRLKGPHLQLARAVVAAELSGYAPSTLDPRWSNQLAEGEAETWWPRELTAVRACAEAHSAGWADFLAVALELADRLQHLPRLEPLGPVPGTAVPQARPRVEVDERVLARVRALLAKAESTTFPAEAETFTAGAQALMARHSIDHAVLAASGRAPTDEPVGRRIGIDAPYEAAKASLLDAIAAANRCRVVWAKELGFATVVGYPTDLDAVEVLFTSLLVQAVSAMTREGSRTTFYGGSRTRSFRQSFLLSYAQRIRERLTQAAKEQVDVVATETGHTDLLPVLASRAETVHRMTEEMFPHLRTHSVGSAMDREGWASGRAAADRAHLTSAAGEVSE